MNQHCKIFISTHISFDLLINAFEQKYHLLSDTPDLLKGAYFDISLDKNEDADFEKAYAFPDGFLYFSYYADILFKEELKDDHLIIAMVSDILEWLWANNYTAIASCDYENLLPEKGGYKSENIPWHGSALM